MGTPKSANDYVILSDLHLAEGRNPSTRRYCRLESFFYDRPFEKLLVHLSRMAEQKGRTWTLVFNGDMIDFLRVTSLPERGNRPKGIPPITSTKQKYGLGTSPAESKWQLERVVKGHPLFFEALARFLLEGHQVVILKGNHDVHWFWPEVRYRFLELLEGFLRNVDPVSPPGATEISEALDRLHFRSWSLYEKGLLYVEHGNQYDPTNAFQNFLYPVRRDPESPVDRYDLELPFGSFFIRFFFNKIQLQFPKAPYYRHASTFFYTLWRRHFYASWYVVKTYLPYFFRALRDVKTRAGPQHEEIARKNERLIRNTGEEYGEPRAVREIAALQEAPAYENKLEFLLMLLEKPAKRFATALGGLLLLSFFWNFLSDWIPRSGLNVVLRSGFSLILDYGFILLGFVWLLAVFRPTKASLSHREADPETLREKAARIASLLRVRYVVFGHSHVEDIWRVPGREAWYVNTGTWTPLIEEEERTLRPEVHFPVLLVEEGKARLMRWNSDAGELEDLPVLEDCEVPWQTG